MKQFIVLLGVLPILLLFMMQFSFDQRNNSNISAVQSIVYSAKENAKQVGCFTPEMQQQLKEDIGAVLEISPELVLVEADEEEKHRYSKGENRLIHYKVSVPITGVMAGEGLFGLSEEENSYIYEIESYAASEKL